jgi:hypothetical protein
METFPKEKQGQAMGIYGLGVVTAPILGPVLGGWITDNFSWRWIFFINVPVGLIAILLMQRFIQDPPWIRNARPARLDIIGFSFMSLWLGCQEVLLDKGQEDDWFGSHFIIVMTVLAVIGLIAFVVRVLTTEKPFVNLRVLKNYNFSLGLALMFFAGISLYGLTTILPLFLQSLMGYTALLSGLTMIPRGLGALAITRDRYTNGLTSDLDVEQAATLLATTKADIPTLETSLQTAIHRLGILLGQPPGTLLAELSTTAPIPVVPPEVPVGLPSELLLRRPDVRRAEQQLAAATANIGVAKADLFPKYFLTGLAGFESISASDWFTGGSSFWSVGPTVQWRIFDAGRIRAKIRVQNARQEQSLASYEQTVLTAFEDVENGLVAYANEQIRHGSLENAVASSRNSLDLANKLYANGLTDFLHVLDAERSLYQAQDGWFKVTAPFL